MELENLFGLPAHPLVVHLAVVMVPLAAVGAVLLAIRPAWIDRYGWWVVGFSGVGAIGAILAAGSGEALEERVDETEALERHAELGETARLVSVVFFLVVLAVVLGRWWLRRRARGHSAGLSRNLTIVMSAALVVAGAAATYTIVEAGHQGAKVTWGDLENEDGHDDDGGDDDEGAPAVVVPEPEPVTFGGVVVAGV